MISKPHDHNIVNNPTGKHYSLNSGVLFIRKTEFTIQFLQEWQRLCELPRKWALDDQVMLMEALLQHAARFTGTAYDPDLGICAKHPNDKRPPSSWNQYYPRIDSRYDCFSKALQAFGYSEEKPRGWGPVCVANLAREGERFHHQNKMIPSRNIVGILTLTLTLTLSPTLSMSMLTTHHPSIFDLLNSLESKCPLRVLSESSSPRT
jgi:hypothetical protein